MLADLSIEKLLALVRLFVLGRERLPAAITWLADSTRRVVDEVQHGLERDLGPEMNALRELLGELGEPLAQLRGLERPGRALARSLATSAVARHDPSSWSPTTSAPPRLMWANPLDGLVRGRVEDHGAGGQRDRTVASARRLLLLAAFGPTASAIWFVIASNL